MNNSCVESSELSPNSTTTIKEVMLRENVVFVHGIHASFWTSDNSLLNRSATWMDKLDIALYLKPTLSISSIRSGERGTALFSRMGLVLADGQIEAAYSVDAGTKANGLFRREPSDCAKQSTLVQAINKSGSHFGRSGVYYNEFVVNSPQHAGFYYCIDSPHDRSLAALSEVMNELQKRQIPLFLLDEGKLYLNADGKKGEQLIKIEPVNIDTERSKSETKRLLSSSVFDVNKLARNNPDLRGSIAFGRGEEGYIQFVELGYNGRFKYYEENLPKNEEELSQRVNQLIFNLAIGNRVKKYYSYMTELGKERIITVENDYGDNSFQKIYCSNAPANQRAQLGIAGSLTIESQNYNPGEFAAALITALEQYNDQILLDGHSYLAGFAAAAVHFKDVETETLIKNYLGQERFSEYEESYRKRLGDDGRLTLLESDILQY